MAEARYLLQSLAKAHETLVAYKTSGIVFGGALSVLFGKKRTLKDLDILVLSFDCEHHPHMGEGNYFERDTNNVWDFIQVDWWLTHDSTERPHNDNWFAASQCPMVDVVLPGGKHMVCLGEVGLLWSIRPRDPKLLVPGLYVFDPEFAKKILALELGTDLPKWRRKSFQNRQKEVWDFQRYAFSYPLLSEKDCELHIFPENAPLSLYCKTRYVDYGGKLLICKPTKIDGKISYEMLRVAQSV